MLHSGKTLTLAVLEERMAVCRLGADAPIPDWATTSAPFSVSRTDAELSIIAPQRLVPEEVRSEKGWRVLRVDGTLDFALTGVLASLAAPLAQSGISVFAWSTFDTDYLLVRETDLPEAMRVLTAAGHRVAETGADFS